MLQELFLSKVVTLLQDDLLGKLILPLLLLAKSTVVRLFRPVFLNVDSVLNRYRLEATSEEIA